jgi:hypothetical protein
MIVSDDHDDNDDDDDDNNNNADNNNTSAELFCKPKQICAFHANFVAARPHGGRKHLVSCTTTLNHTRSALSPSAFYVTGKRFSQNI